MPSKNCILLTLKINPNTFLKEVLFKLHRTYEKFTKNSLKMRFLLCFTDFKI